MTISPKKEETCAVFIFEDRFFSSRNSFVYFFFIEQINARSCPAIFISRHIGACRGPVPKITPSLFSQTRGFFFPNSPALLRLHSTHEVNTTNTFSSGLCTKKLQEHLPLALFEGERSEVSSAKEKKAKPFCTLNMNTAHRYPRGNYFQWLASVDFASIHLTLRRKPVFVFTCSCFSKLTMYSTTLRSTARCMAMRTLPRPSVS